jgi:hypothetical protein
MSEARRSGDESTLVLRVSVPTGDAYHTIAKELAAKVAAYVGDPDPDGKAAVAAIDEVMSRVLPDGGRHDAEVEFEFRRTDEELLIQARCDGRSADSRRPLPS